MPGERTGPLYKWIKHDLRSRIVSAELLPGALLPTRSELAEQYSTTQTTVNRAINELTREGLISSRSGRRTSVATQGQEESGAIAVVWNLPEDVLTLDEEYYGPLMSGIRQACAAHKIDVVFRASSVFGYSNIVCETRARGLLVLAPTFQDMALLERIHAEGTPIVAAPGPRETTTVPVVLSDHRSGIRQAVDHLTALGHTDIAFLSYTVSIPDQFERQQGYLEAMRTHGLAINAGRLHIEPNLHPGSYMEAVRTWLTPTALPTAIITGSFVMGLAVIRRLREIDARIPEDVSLIHFDAPLAAAHLDPPTSGILQNIPAISETAVNQLVRLMKREPVETRCYVPTRLIVRESTAPPRRPQA